MVKREGLSAGKHRQVGMYLAGQWYRLTVKQPYLTDDPVKGLDVSLLQDLLLAPILGIGDPRTEAGFGLWEESGGFWSLRGWWTARQERWPSPCIPPRFRSCFP